MDLSKDNYKIKLATYFITIIMILAGFISVTTSRPINEPNMQPLEVPRINIQKLVWDGNTWTNYAEVNLGDTVQFKGEICNPNENYTIYWSGWIYDLFPNNLNYINGSLNVIWEDSIVYWDEVVDWENNSVTWCEIDEIPPGECVIFYYNATAVDCGLGVNTLSEVSWTLVCGERYFLNATDEATINIICTPPETPEIIFEKLVWDGNTWTDYAEVNLGDIVQFKGEICNPNENYTIYWSGWIYDLFPNNLNYINGSLNVIWEDSIVYWDEAVDWENNSVTWCEIDEIPPGECVIFYYNATAVDCGLGVNTLSEVSWTLVDGERYFLNATDEATIYVDCSPQFIPDISVEKYVKFNCNGTYAKIIDAEVGNFVTFKLIVNNTGDTELDITVVDTLPDGLDYRNGHATPTEPFITGNVLTWYFNDTQPGVSIIVTFEADVVNCGTLVNLVNVTGFYENLSVYDEDTAIVNSTYGWDKSSIQVTGECDSPNAVFTITNTGENMQGLSEYRVYRNNVLEETVNFQLNAGESLIVTILADCDTIRLEADQRPGHPGQSTPQETIEDCGCDENEFEVDIETGLNIGKINAYIKNNKKTDLSNITWEISIKNTGLLNLIDSKTNNVISVLKSKTKEKIQTQFIWGFGIVKIEIKAKALKVSPILTTTNGLVIGRLIIVFPSY